MTDKSSLYIDSQPKIRDIDYIVYILGSLRTSFGFSFIGIDPVSRFLSFKSMNVNID